jgi:hypothetical protein
LPAGAVPQGGLAGAEKAEIAIRVKLKPALYGGSPETPALPGSTGVNLPEVTITRPVTPNPLLAAAPAAKTMPTLVPAPRIAEIPAPKKPGRRALPGVVLVLLVLCVACLLWLFFRAHSSAPVAAKPPPSEGSQTVPAVTKHPPAVSEPAGNATTGAPAVLPAKTANALTPASPPAPAAVELPPPPDPSPQFRLFVERLKVSGVRNGPPARLFVEGLACRPGDVIDRSLNVVFVGVDPATNEIIFKDATGAVIRRRF